MPQALPMGDIKQVRSWQFLQRSGESRSVIDRGTENQVDIGSRALATQGSGSIELHPAEIRKLAQHRGDLLQRSLRQAPQRLGCRGHQRRSRSTTSSSSDGAKRSRISVYSGRARFTS